MDEVPNSTNAGPLVAIAFVRYEMRALFENISNIFTNRIADCLALFGLSSLQESKRISKRDRHYPSYDKYSRICF